MSHKPNFVVVGSGGGGGTIAWLLAKAGYSVMLLEQGPDITKEFDVMPGHPQDPAGFNSSAHREEYFRLRRPDPKRRLRGDYTTFRRTDVETAKPFVNGWTGSVLGGGSTIWGTWSYRPMPLDFVLNTHYAQTRQLAQLDQDGYKVVDWPIDYADMLPYYRVAEALMGVSGDRTAMNQAVTESAWYKAFKHPSYFGDKPLWFDETPLPCGAYPITPVGHFAKLGMATAGMWPVPLPCAIVQPGSAPYQTREKIAAVLAGWTSSDRPEFWQQKADQIWSDAKRNACNMCGFCGEYICWGKEEAPKFGTRVTTLRELADLQSHGRVQIRCNAKAIEVIYDKAAGRATGVRYLDIGNADRPVLKEQLADNVIVSCGAIQTARLLRMSGPTEGLGNRGDQLGRNATFHLFGLGAKITLDKAFQGMLHGEFGPTGNVTSFEPYFLQDPASKDWIKAGTLTSTAKKNPLENAAGYFDGAAGAALEPLKAIEKYARSLELRLTADDLPMPRNRVDLDPKYVDEYGIPAARVTRDLGPNEWRMYGLARPMFESAVAKFRNNGNKKIVESFEVSPAIVNLIGDHQMGTCRMGPDDDTLSQRSVLDSHCRLHEAKNVFVVDSSFMPTGFGLNPMLTVVANALRVGSWIVQQEKRGALK
jgi:choline dehydrogenase-like flavoprotein